MRAPIALAVLSVLGPLAAWAQEDPVAPAPPGRGASLRVEAEALAERLRPWAGRPVAEVVVTCNVARCRDPEQARALRTLTRVPPGRPLEPAAVARGWLHLTRTGFFRRIEPLIEELPPGEAAAPGAVRVRYDARAHLIISDIDIRYADATSALYPKQFDTEIRKRVLLRKGGHFDPTDRASLEQQRRQIVELYERQGYTGTTVSIVPEYHGENDQLVRLTIVVDEGSQPWLGQVLVRGNRAFPYARVVGPLSTGERADFWRPFFGFLGIGKYDRRRFLDELDEVERMYRREGWLTARVRRRGEARDGDVVHPLVDVYEGPRVEVVFEGNRALSDEDLAEVTTFAESGAIDAMEIEATIEAIRTAYQASAHYYATVTHERATLADGTVRITFRIDEGPAVYVREVVVAGNRELSDDVVRGAMETQGIAEDGVIWGLNVSPGVLQDARVTNDLTAIRELYREHGFLGVHFRCKAPDAPLEAWTARRLAEIHGRPVPEGLPGPRFDVWTSDPTRYRCFVVERDADPRLVRIYIELDEGLRTTVDRLGIDVMLAGMDADMQDEARDLLLQLGLKDETGRWIPRAGLNRRKIESVRGFLLKYFRRQGNLQAQVEPRCDEDPTRPCDHDVLYGRHYDTLPFESVPGPRTVVDGILLDGNLRTDDDVILDELLFRPGQALSADGLFLSQANLRSLGIFESVRVETLGDRLPEGFESSLLGEAPERTDRRDATVLVTVEEGEYRLLDAHLGLRVDSTDLGTTDLPILYVAGAGIRDRNLFGSAIEVGLAGEHSNRVDSPQDYLGDDATWQIGPYLQDRRLFGTRLELVAGLRFTLSRTEQRDQYAQRYTLESDIGYDFYNLSYPSDWGRGMRASLRTELQREQRRGLVRKGERPPFGDPIHSITLGPGFDIDKRDSPLHPTRGWLLQLRGDVLFQTDATAAQTLTPSIRETVAGQVVWSFFERRLIVVPTLRLGAVQTDEREADLKSDFLFKAGGDRVTLPVRGYPDAAIEACGGVPDKDRCAGARDEDDVPVPIGGRAMAAGSLELRFPTFVLEDFWWAVFADVGAVAPTWADMDADRLHPSAGVGLRWLVLGQLPLRLDLGFPLRTNAFTPTRDPRFHLSIFYSL